MKTLLSWNINGIRAAAQKGLTDWMQAHSTAALGFQEVKAKLEQVPESVSLALGSRTFHLNDAEKAGYSGVSVALPAEWGNAQVTFGLDIPEFDREGRLITVEWDDLIFINGYYPNGGRDLSRVDFKLEFSEAVLQHAKKLKSKGKPIVLTGDFNTAHHPIDLANPKSNEKTTGFLPHERAWLDRFLAHDFVDCFRYMNGDVEGAYTWWTYRGDCRERNIGWRIDYFFIDTDHLDLVLDCYHEPHVLGSDHCPLGLVLDL